MLKGYVCPPGTPTNETQRPGQRNEIDHCLNTCQNPCVSPPLLESMWHAEQWNHHKGTYLSVSMLSGEGCPRQTWFERQRDIEVYENARRRFWPFRGTIAHSLIEQRSEKSARAGWMQELRMSVPLVFEDHYAPILDEHGNFTGRFHTDEPLTITLGGTTDAFNPVRRLLHDFKTLSDLKIEPFLNGEEGGELHPQIKDSWVRQVNSYRWLISQTRITDAHRAFATAHGWQLDGEFFQAPERLQMQLLSMMEIPLTGITYRHKKKSEKLPDGKWRVYDAIDYEIGEVPVLPLEEIEAFIRPKALEWYRWLVLGEEPPLPPNEKWWLCTSCPFNKQTVDQGLCAGIKRRWKRSA